MVRQVVKIFNATYMCGIFAYYMLQHEWSVLQALTFQVHCGMHGRLIMIKMTVSSQNWLFTKQDILDAMLSLTNMKCAFSLHCISYQGLLLLAVYCLLALLEEQIPGLTSLTSLLQNISFPLATFIGNDR